MFPAYAGMILHQSTIKASMSPNGVNETFISINHNTAKAVFPAYAGMIPEA